LPTLQTRDACSENTGKTHAAAPRGKNGWYGAAPIGKRTRGDLIHERGLETARNIHDEVLLTDGWRERVEIESLATLSESVRRRKAFAEAASVIKALNVTTDDLDPGH
jgi:hypothetical protein